MNTGALPIGYPELALATCFICAAGALSAALSLGLGKQLAIGTVRTYFQLLALGIVLRWVFIHQAPGLVIGILILMTAAAANILLGRVKSAPTHLFSSAFWSVLVSGITVTFAVTQLIIHVHPWYRAQYVLPIAGMIFGNSMTGVALALERIFGDLKQRSDEVWTYLALGATPWEAALPSVRTALAAALIPTINSMSAVGIVSIPGMMTGQILSGADPETAAKYQVVVMLMLSAATAIGSMLAVLFAFRRAFDAEGRLISIQGNR